MILLLLVDDPNGGDGASNTYIVLRDAKHGSVGQGPCSIGMMAGDPAAAFRPQSGAFGGAAVRRQRAAVAVGAARGGRWRIGGDGFNSKPNPSVGLFRPSLTVLALNLVGEGINDALNPRLRG